jgi:hypothetical protein
MACLLYASSTPLSDIERHLMQHQLGEGAAGAVRALADRTRDLIPAVTRVFFFLHPDVAIGDVAERTMVRLELGLPVELVELGLIFGAALTRAQYLRLLERGITAPEQFKATESTVLIEDLGIAEAQIAELHTLLQTYRSQQNDTITPLLPAPTE